MRANFEDTNWRGIKIPCGSFITSLNTLSSETGLSIQNVRTSLEKLISTGELTSKTTNKNRLISIVSYKNYQDSNKQLTTTATNNQQTTNKQLTTDKEIKEIKEDKNIYIDRFLEFWDLYGIKKDRTKCEIKYIQLLKKGQDHEEVMRGVRAYQAECRAKGTSEQYIKRPLTFINGKCWNDSYSQQPTKPIAKSARQQWLESRGLAQQG